jgi:hypothetical protein
LACRGEAVRSAWPASNSFFGLAGGTFEAIAVNVPQSTLREEYYLQTKRSRKQREQHFSPDRTNPRGARTDSRRFARIFLPKNSPQVNHTLGRHLRGLRNQTTAGYAQPIAREELADELTPQRFVAAGPAPPLDLFRSISIVNVITSICTVLRGEICSRPGP